MKVIHLLPALEEGGVEHVVLNLVRILASHGHSALVVSRGGKLVPEVARLNGRHLALDLKSKNPLTYFSRARKLRQLLERERPDLVCVHSRVPAWLYRATRLHLPLITYAHGANSISRYSAIMTRGDRIIVPSKFLADYLLANYRFDPSKLRIVPNLVDTSKFDPAHLDLDFIAEKRREWNLEPDSKVTMAIGRLTPLKGFDTLIKSTPPDRKLIIVGGADKDKLDYFAYLKSLAGPNVVFAGAQTKIAECMALADEIVSANTTKPESFGLSIAEAYAMNKSVRALKRFGGVGEIMDAVEREITSGRAKNYRESVHNLYNFDIISRKTLEIYQELLK